MRLSENTYIPLQWFLMMISSVVIVSGLGAFWVKSVDDRLTRIEQKLGIPPMAETPDIPTAADAAMRGP